jgi:branched-chain amino acid transport system substrate-binding protein
VERFNGIPFNPSVYEGFEYSPNVIYGGAVQNQLVLPLMQHIYTEQGRKIALIGTDTLTRAKSIGSSASLRQKVMLKL